MCVAADVVENNLTLLSVVVEKEIQYVEVVVRVVSFQLEVPKQVPRSEGPSLKLLPNKQQYPFLKKNVLVLTYLLQLKKRSGSACSRIEIVAFSRKTKSGRKEGRH